VAAVSGVSVVSVAAVRREDQRAAGATFHRPLVRHGDQRTADKSLLRRSVRHADHAAGGRSPVRRLIRHADQPGLRERRAFQATIGAALPRRMERRPIQPAEERRFGAPMIVVVRRYERWAFQANGDETRMAGTPR